MINIERFGEVTKFRLARTLMGRSFYFTAAYLVDGLMVDTGCAHTVTELTETLKGSRIHTVVNTHSHEDHVAANHALQVQFGARLFAHPDALPVLANPRLVHLRPYQRVMWGYPEACAAEPIPEFVETERHRFRIIHTPGHSRDHICLFEPREGWLFSGDAYVGGRDRVLRRDYNIWQIIDSLKKLAALEPNVVFAGSGSIRNDAREELTRKIQYLEDTGERVLALNREGWSMRRISAEVLGREILMEIYTLGHYSGKNLVRSFIKDYTERAGGINQ